MSTGRLGANLADEQMAPCRMASEDLPGPREAKRNSSWKGGAVDLGWLRSLYDAHNSAGEGFPDVLARDYLHTDAEFVEFAAAPGGRTHSGREAIAALFRERFEAGAMRIEDLELTAIDERTALAAFRIHMRGSGSGAETSMPLWNLITVDGAQIVRVEEFSDEDAALAAAGRGGEPAV
jgi:hypothetical protein